MIDKEELLTAKNLQIFKSGEELIPLFKQLYKSAVEHMLSGDLYAHLHNEKHKN